MRSTFLSPLLFQRPDEIRQTERQDVDLVAREWRYLVTNIVPLSRQAVKIFEDIKPLIGSGRYVFPSSRGDGRPMSDNFRMGDVMNFPLSLTALANLTS